MAEDNNFDLPEAGNESQEAKDRNRRRKSDTRSWDLRSPQVRARANRPRVRVNLDPATGEFAGFVRDVPEVQSRMTSVTAGSGIAEDPTAPSIYNADHIAGKHEETPDLQGCVNCQINARKHAKNAALAEGKSLFERFMKHPTHVRAAIREMVGLGFPMADALEHVRKNPKKFRLPASQVENEEQEQTGKPSRRGQAAIAAAEEVKGAPLEEWEKLLAKGKTVEQILLSDEDRRKIHSKAGKGTLPTVPEIKPVEMFKKHPETGELIPYDTRDYIRHHTAEHKKAQAAGDSVAAKFHLKRIKVLKGEESEVETRQGDYIPATGVWEQPIISRDEAVDSLLHADDTGQDQCFMKCRMSEIHSQCPKHGQLLRPE